ncbi:MAG: hypothetical protein P9L97_00715 [Candidatus Tenebribacter davisii]|nr:hypothetical protein [Candidatus Tenebribacter davisii]
MKKQELKNRIIDWAYEYAKTGDYENYQAIEFQLCYVDGYLIARTVLDDYFIRDELNEFCQEARRKKQEKV